MYTQEEIAYIWLDSFFEGNSAVKRDLLSAAGDALCFALNPEKFSSILIKSGKEGVYNRIRESLKDNSYTRKIMGELKERELIAVPLSSSSYPEELLQLSPPPTVLYCKGNLSLLKGDKFAVVGSRHTNENALKQANNYARELAQHFTVVTGVADGGDAAVIDGAKESGKLVCVLPCGMDELHPSPYSGTMKEVVDMGGLLVGEYPPFVRAQKFSFLRRNSLIAALGKGVLAVSAGEKSGVLSTAFHAIELGKEVFAFPYNQGVESGKGCNALIKKGAYLCDNIVDILSCFGIDLKNNEETPLSSEEQAILTALRESDGLHINQLAEKLALPVTQLSATLLMLEMQGLVVKIGGNRYSAV